MPRQPPLPPSSHSAPVLYVDSDDPAAHNARAASPQTPRDSGSRRELPFNFMGTSSAVAESDAKRRALDRDEIWKLVTQRAKLRYGLDQTIDPCPGPTIAGEAYVAKGPLSIPVEEGTPTLSHVNQGPLSNFLVRMKTKTLGRRHSEEQKPYFSELPKVSDGSYEHLDAKLGIQCGDKHFRPPQSRGIGCACWVGLTDRPVGTVDQHGRKRGGKSNCCDSLQVKGWFNCFRFAFYRSRYNENQDCLVCNKPLADPVQEAKGPIEAIDREEQEEGGRLTRSQEASKERTSEYGQRDRGENDMEVEASSATTKMQMQEPDDMDVLELAKQKVSATFPTEEELAEGHSRSLLQNGASSSARPAASSSSATPKSSSNRPEKRTSSFIEGAVAAAVSRTSSLATNASFRAAARPTATDVTSTPSTSTPAAPANSNTNNPNSSNNPNNSNNNNSSNTSNPPAVPALVSPVPSMSPAPIHTPPSSNPASFVASFGLPLGTASTFSSAPSLAPEAISRSRSREIE